MSGLDKMRFASHVLLAVVAISVPRCLPLAAQEISAPAAFQVPDTQPAAASPKSMPTPASPEMMGDLYMVEHRYVAALNAYQSVPVKSAVVWNKTGMAYHHLFALEAARKDYEEALKLNPHYAEALNNLGAVFHGEKQYKQSEHAYKRAIKYQPSAVAWCNLGTTYFAEHKYKQGIKAYQRAYAVDPKVFAPAQASMVESGSSAEQRSAVNYSMAKLYASAGKQEEALEALRKALDSGFKDRKRLFEDAEFASLRQTTEFQQLIVEQRMR